MLLINILILLLAIPVGYLIAYLCKDELVSYKKYFRILMIVGIIGAIGFKLYGLLVESLTMLFLLVIALMSFLLSGNKKFLRRYRDF